MRNDLKVTKSAGEVVFVQDWQVYGLLRDASLRRRVDTSGWCCEQRAASTACSELLAKGERREPGRPLRQRTRGYTLAAEPS